jgi:hypothetical protein
MGQSYPDPSNEDFGFAVSPAPDSAKNTPTQANGSVIITLKGANMWKVQPAARAALMANFSTFLESIETRLELPKLLLPGSTQRIAQVIAALLPAPPAESLFYRYSFSSGFAAGTLPYVDIRSGMQLRVDVQASQFLTPTSAMNGYVNSGSFLMRVSSAAASDGSRVIAFDPFLTAIKAPVVSGPASSPVAVGGLVDVQPPGGARTYWRLIYPATISSPSQPGDLAIADNVTLIGASTLAELNAATQSYPAIDAGGTPPNIYAIFLGRAVAVPEIPVWVGNGGQAAFEYVPLGTTLGDLIERFTSPPVDPASITTPPLMRTMPASWVGTNPTSLVLTTTNLVSVPRYMWDVPLVAGDVVTIPS